MTFSTIFTTKNQKTAQYSLPEQVSQISTYHAVYNIRNKHFSTCCRFWTWNTVYTAFSIEIRTPSHIDQNYPLIKDDTKQHGRKKWSIWQVFHPCESLLLNAAPKSATCEKNFNSRLMIKLLLEKLILHSLWVVFHFLQEDLAQKLVIGNIFWGESLRTSCNPLLT